MALLWRIHTTRPWAFGEIQLMYKVGRDIKRTDRKLLLQREFLPDCHIYQNRNLGNQNQRANLRTAVTRYVRRERCKRFHSSNEIVAGTLRSKLDDTANQIQRDSPAFPRLERRLCQQPSRWRIQNIPSSSRRAVLEVPFVRRI